MPVAAGLFRLRGLHGHANWAFYRAAASPPACSSSSRGIVAPASTAVAAAGAASSSSRSAAAAAAKTAPGAAGAAHLPAAAAAARTAPGAAEAAFLPAAAAAAATAEESVSAAGARSSFICRPAAAAEAGASCCCTSAATGAGGGGGAAAARGVGGVARIAETDREAAAATAAETDREAGARGTRQQQVPHDARHHAAGEQGPSTPQQQREKHEQQQQQRQQEVEECSCDCVAEQDGGDDPASSSTGPHATPTAAACARETTAPRQLLVVFLGDISDFFVPPSPHSSAAVQGQRRKQQQQQQRQHQEEWEQQQRQEWQQRRLQQGWRPEEQEQQKGQEAQERQEQEQQQGQAVHQQWEEEEEEARNEDEDDAFCCSHYPYSLEGILWLLSSRFPTHAVLLVRPAAVVRHHAVYRHFLPCDALGVPYSIEEALAFFRLQRRSIPAADSSSHTVSSTGSSNSPTVINGNPTSSSSSSTVSSRSGGNRGGTLKHNGSRSTPERREISDAGECIEAQLLGGHHKQQQSSPLQASAAAAAVAGAARGCSSKEDEQEAVLAGASLAGENGTAFTLPQLQRQRGSPQAAGEATRKEDGEEAAHAAAGSSCYSPTSGKQQSSSEDSSDPFSAAQHLICLLNSLVRRLRQQQRQQSSTQAVLLQQQQQPVGRERLLQPQQQRRQPQNRQLQQLQQHLLHVQQQERTGHSEQPHRGQRTEAEQQQQQQRGQEAQQNGGTSGEMKSLQEEVKQQWVQEEVSAAATACDAAGARRVSVSSDGAYRAANTFAACCCCGVVLDEYWQHTAITLLGFSKGAAVVLSCLRSKCRCWRYSAARKEATSACCNEQQHAVPRSGHAAEAAPSWQSPSHGPARGGVHRRGSVAATAAAAPHEPSHTRGNSSSGTEAASPRVVAADASLCGSLAADTRDGVTGSCSWSPELFAPAVALAARPAGATSSSYTPGVPAPAAASLPQGAAAACIRDECCRGRSTAVCPALSSLWSRVHALHIVDGGLSVPHVLFEIAPLQLLARFQPVPPAVCPGVATPAQSVLVRSVTVAGFSGDATQQQQRRPHERQPNAWNNTGQEAGSVRCCCCRGRDRSTSNHNSSNTPTSHTARCTTTSTEGDTHDTGASSSSSVSSNYATSGSTRSSSTPTTDIKVIRSRCVSSCEQCEGHEARRAAPWGGELDAETEYVELEAATGSLCVPGVHEGSEAGQCAVLRQNYEKQALQVPWKSREIQSSVKEQQGGLQQIWVHCSSRQLFDARRPFIRGETLGFLRTLLRTAQVCDLPARGGAVTTADTTDCAKQCVGHANTTLTTVGFARYYMPRIQRRALCVGPRGSTSAAGTREALADNTTANGLAKHAHSFPCRTDMEAAPAQPAAGVHSDGNLHGPAACLERETHQPATGATAPVAAGAVAVAPATLAEVLSNHHQEVEAQEDAEAEMFSCRVAVDPNFGLDVHFNLLSDATLALQLSSARRHSSTMNKTAAPVSVCVAAAYEDRRRGSDGRTELAPARNVTTSTHGVAGKRKHAVAAESNDLGEAGAQHVSSPTRTPCSPVEAPLGQLGCAGGTAARTRETESGERLSEFHGGPVASDQWYVTSRLLEVDVPVPQRVFFEEWRELSGTRFF